MIQVVEGHDEPDVVLVDEAGRARPRVARVCDPRHDRLEVGVEEGGRERGPVRAHDDGARPWNARTMSTRWPFAQVRSTTLTSGEGTRPPEDAWRSSRPPR